MKVPNLCKMYVAMILLAVCSVLATDYEQILFSSTYPPRSITAANTSDIYTVVLPLPGRLVVDISTDGTQSALPNQSVEVQWLNANGIPIKSSSGGIDFPYNDFMDLDTGTYYVEVVGLLGEGNTGTYNLRVDCIVDEIKPNNTIGNAQLLSSGYTVNGNVTAQANGVFRYVLTEPGRLSLNITRGTLPNSGANVNWLNANGDTIGRGNSNNWGVSFPYNGHMDLEKGTYYIAITKYKDNTGTYNLRGDFIAAGNNDDEPNNMRSNAQPLTSSQIVNGFISYQDDTDMYRYVLTESGRLSLNITRGTLPNSGINVNWRDTDGNIIGRGNSNNWGVSFPYNGHMDLEEGTYYIEIVKYKDNTGTYDLTGTIIYLNAATPIISTQPINATYERDAEAISLSVTASITDDGTLSYQWYSNTINSTVGGTAVGTNSRTYIPVTTLTGTLYYYVVVTNTNSSVSGNKIAVVTSNVATVTVEITESVIAADNADIMAAKTMLEGTDFGSVAQSMANSQGMTREFVEGIIAELELNGVDVVVLDSIFITAEAGTVGNISGTDGNYMFIAKLSKGAGTEQVTKMLTLVITAMPYNNTTVSLPHIAKSLLFAYATSNSIVFGNMPRNTNVEVYDFRGKRIYSGNSGDFQILKILVQTKGMYIIKVSFGSEKQILQIVVR